MDVKTPKPKKIKWYKLDNAAKIYPAAKTRSWTAIFRLSAQLNEKIDPAVLQLALERTAKRLPGFTLRLRPGLFWYYLEPVSDTPQVQPDVANPCVRMKLNENGCFMFRVRYYEKRIALEVFHVLSDGTGGLCFLETLVAEYLTLRYGVVIRRGGRILDCEEPPSPGELEDAFMRYSRGTTKSMLEGAAYRIHGTKTDPHFVNIVTGLMPASEVLAKAHDLGVSVTEFLVSTLIWSVYTKQKTDTNMRRRLTPVKICVPVNMRKFYRTRTLRNFSCFVNPGIDPKYGEYTYEEILRRVKAFMALEATEKMMNARISSNVSIERYKALRAMPLFIKNQAMSVAFLLNGDKTSSTTFSNLGGVNLPPEMKKYVERLDFMIGSLKYNPVSAACASYNGTTVINFTRTIEEPDIERVFFTTLVKLGIHVKVESNRRY